MTGIVHRVLIPFGLEIRRAQYVYCGSLEVARQACELLGTQEAPRALTSLKTSEGMFVLGDDQERVQIRVLEWEDLVRLRALAQCGQSTPSSPFSSAPAQLLASSLHEPKQSTRCPSFRGRAPKVAPR